MSGIIVREQICHLVSKENKNMYKILTITTCLLLFSCHLGDKKPEKQPEGAVEIKAVNSERALVEQDGLDIDNTDTMTDSISILVDSLPMKNKSTK